MKHYAIAGVALARRWQMLGVLALAGAVGLLAASSARALTINGCVIQPKTYCLRPNLANANLSGANLALAYLPGANLSGANLSRAYLPDANLAEADLRDAKAQHADFASALLVRGNLSRADLQHVVFARANLRRADLRRADLRNANLRRADLLNADLTDANLQAASFCQTTMPDGSIRSDPAGCGSSLTRLAAGLAARDPGARVDGDTVAVTGAGARVRGARDRPNFIAALGSNETIVGGNRGDNLGALGDHATIIGGGGNDLLYGGRNATLVGGGGRDLLVDRGANATIRAASGDVVIAVGRHDRVLCSRRSRDVTVYAGRSDSVSSTCRAGHGRVLSPSSVRQPRPPAARPSVVKGDGSNDHPFVAPCDDPGNVDCTVTAFPQRSLSGPWANEYVPAYQCPSDHPYLLRHYYAPPWRSWGPGAEAVREEVSPWGFPIDVSITGNSYFDEPKFPNMFGGTLTGFPNSSATNWVWGGTHWYRIVLHCSSNRCHGTDLVGPPPGCPDVIADRRRQAATTKRSPRQP